jgi:outer membrane receptor for ferric coprogen and ferric-rhodotorulic acid
MFNKKLGAFVSGFVADQKNSWIAYSDYEKLSLNARIDYSFNPKTRLTAALNQNNYSSDMTGSIDSIAFYSRQYEASNNFAYRKIRALRASLRLDHRWNDHAETFATVFFRDNAMGQNPSYSFRWTAPSTKATGEINENAFKSYGFLVQHSQGFKFLQSKILLGLSYDDSPARYFAYKTEMTATLRADKKSVSKYTLDRELPEVFLSNYQASIYNTGVYAQLELVPLSKMKVVLGGRIDRMSFDFLNFIDNSTGTKAYQQFTPKIGLTYDLTKGNGLYANASKGFSPPSLNAIFRLRPNPVPQGDLFYFNLLPAVFNNIEIGGWATALHKKIYFDWAIYQMKGQNELLNIRQQDNSFDYQSAGETLHRGIEYSITYKSNSQWFMRFGGTNAVHRYIKFDLSLRASDLIKNVDGKDMPVAPTWIYNTEIIYKPIWLKGFRIAAEWQRLNGYFQNQVNSMKYEDRGFLGAKGVSLLNIRAGFQVKSVELFMNILNASNELYANNITRGNLPTDRPNFTASAPRTVTVGMQYNFVGK